MININEIYEGIREMESARIRVGEISDKLRNASIESIECLEKGEKPEMLKLKDLFSEAKGFIEGAPHLFQELDNAFVIYAETTFLIAFLEGKNLPGYESVEVTPCQYVKALKAFVKDLRKLFLKKVGAGENDGAKGILEEIELVFSALEKAGADGTEELEPMVDRSREEIALMDYRKKKDSLDLDSVWFK